jgi:hypothetical protein
MVNHIPHLCLGNSGIINIHTGLGSNGISSILLCLGSSGISTILMGLIINGNNKILGYLGSSGIINILMGLIINGNKCFRIETSKKILNRWRGELFTSFLFVGAKINDQT